MSVATFIFYAIDKYRARHGGWRITGKTLHLLDLAGGWPGGLAAQRALHHKSRKSKFQAVFWVTAGLHAAVWAVVFFYWRP